MYLPLVTKVELRFIIPSFNIIISTTMRYLKSTTYARCLLLDVFGVGAVAGAGASIAASSLTNQTNKEIAEKNNKTQLQIHESDKKFNAEEAEKVRQFNAEEAEKARHFNAEEAEKARQWNSESEVVKRRAEAGLNTALTGTSPASSAPSASSSPASSSPVSAPPAPSLTTPYMQSPDVASAINAVVNLAKADSEISKNDASAKQQLADADYKIQQADYQRIVNNWQPQTCRATLDSLIQKNKLTQADIQLKNAQLEGLQMQMDKFFMEGLSLYYQTLVSVEDFNQRADFFLAQFPKEYDKLQQDAELFIKQWQQNGYDMSYRWGKSSHSYDGWNVGGDASAHRGRSVSRSQSFTSGQSTKDGNSKDGTLISSVKDFAGDVLSTIGGVGISINGGYQDYDESKESFRNEDIYKFFVEMQGCKNIASSKHFSKEIQDKALQRINRLTLSAEGYHFFMLQMGKYKRLPSNLKQQDFDDQQY